MTYDSILGSVRRTLEIIASSDETTSFFALSMKAVRSLFSRSRTSPREDMAVVWMSKVAVAR